MIRRRDELADLRDRAVRDAWTIDELRTRCSALAGTVDELRDRIVALHLGGSRSPVLDWSRVHGSLGVAAATREIAAGSPVVMAAMDQSDAGWRDELAGWGLDANDPATVFTLLVAMSVVWDFAARWGLLCDGMRTTLTSACGAFARFAPEEARS